MAQQKKALQIQRYCVIIAHYRVFRARFNTPCVFLPFTTFRRFKEQQQKRQLEETSNKQADEDSHERQSRSNSKRKGKKGKKGRRNKNFDPDDDEARYACLLVLIDNSKQD